MWSCFSNFRFLYTLCPRGSDPLYVVTYYMNGSLLPGQTVCSAIVYMMKWIFINTHSSPSQVFASNHLLYGRIIQLEGDKAVVKPIDWSAFWLVVTAG